MKQQNPHTNPRNTVFPRITRTLQVDILVAFATLLVVTVFIIVGYTYQQNSSAILRLSDDLITQVNTNVIERTTNYLAPAAIMAQASAQIPQVDEMSLIDNAELESYGMEVLALYPQLAGFFIGNEQGDFIFTKRFPDTTIGTQVIDRSLAPPERTWTYRDLAGEISDVEMTTDFTYDPRQRPWYIGAADSGQQHWTDIYIFFTDQKPGITAAFPIVSATNNLVGVIGVDVALDELSAFLQTQTVGETGVAFILTESGELVAFPGEALAVEEGESFRPVHVDELASAWIGEAYALHQTDGDERFLFESNGVRYIGSFTPFPDSFGKSWKIGVVVPQDDFIGSIRQTNRVSLLMSVAILIIAIISAIFVSRSISRPIMLLASETQKIKDFDLESSLEVQSAISEVKLLNESIKAMRTGLSAFQKYVPAALVRQLIQTGEEAQLGGHKRELSILFTDIVGFTTITEGMPPQGLLLQLSDYLGAMATIVMGQNGTVDKFVGDGIMAFWGAPLRNINHANDACRAALEMCAKVDMLNGVWLEKGMTTFPTRIGIHTGDTLVGNMGSSERMNYTIVGDSVNLASRLEAINDIYGTRIIVTVDTYWQAQERFHFRPLDVVTVKGKREYILLYELMGERGVTPAGIVHLAQEFAKGYEEYLAQNWNTALEIFTALSKAHPEDTATQIYMTRCVALSKEPPGPDWNPIVHLEEKHRSQKVLT